MVKVGEYRGKRFTIGTARIIEKPFSIGRETSYDVVANIPQTDLNGGYELLIEFFTNKRQAEQFMHNLNNDDA